jgi:hypothetical protein
MWPKVGVPADDVDAGVGKPSNVPTASAAEVEDRPGREKPVGEGKASRK